MKNGDRDEARVADAVSARPPAPASRPGAMPVQDAAMDRSMGQAQGIVRGLGQIGQTMTESAGPQQTTELNEKGGNRVDAPIAPSSNHVPVQQQVERAGQQLVNTARQEKEAEFTVAGHESSNQDSPEEQKKIQSMLAKDGEIGQNEPKPESKLDALQEEARKTQDSPEEPSPSIDR